MNLKYEIESPVKNYTGIGANVAFAKGTAYVKELRESQTKYFKKKGYKITDISKGSEKTYEKPELEGLNNNTSDKNENLEDLEDDVPKIEDKDTKKGLLNRK